MRIVSADDCVAITAALNVRDVALATESTRYPMIFPEVMPAISKRTTVRQS